MADTPITKLSGLDITPDTENEKFTGFFLPQLSEPEIDATVLRNGALVYDTTANAIKAYINGSWYTLATA